MVRNPDLRYTPGMRLILPLVLALAVQPCLAQDSDVAPGEDDGFSLIERGSRMLLEEFLNRLDPALEELQREMGPALEDLQRELGPVLEGFQEQLGRLDAYHPPEILPNGDIILRRKQPGETTPVPVPEPEPDESIEL